MHATTNQACCVMGDSNVLDTKFVFYWLQFSRDVIISLYSTGGGQPNINQESVTFLRIPAPIAEEQTQIAHFLDHETARIDALIAEQQRLIELLKEKRQAVISHAVTKGLDPTVPMKDSGVEWLGEVPEHWDIKKFGHISIVVRGSSPRPAGDPELFNGDYSPWVTVVEITKDDEIYLSETETYLTVKGSALSRVFAQGTLLLSNSGATVLRHQRWLTSKVRTCSAITDPLTRNPAGTGISVLISGFTVLVIGETITRPPRAALKAVWLTTKQGRASPICSLPCVGFKLMRITSPRRSCIQDSFATAILAPAAHCSQSHSHPWGSKNCQEYWPTTHLKRLRSPFYE